MENKLLIIFCVFFCLVLFTGCPDTVVDPPPSNPLQLTVTDATCTEAYLSLSLSANQTQRTVTLKRGDSTIATITITGKDSLYTDQGLLPKKTYTYTLVKDNWTATAQATTQDTTAHDVQWQMPDTLGAQGVIRDVWVFSKTDAWAVGQIYLTDSTGKVDQENPYNAAHWDGNKWEIKKITVNFRGNAITPPIDGIFALSPTQIWLVGSLPMYGDGTNWTIYDLRTTLNPNISLSKVWGLSSQNMYFVGMNGNVVHYENGSWSTMESNTTVNLQDIWGIDENHIWATGTTTSNGHSVVLQFDGTKWTTIYDNTNKPFNEKFGFNSVWTDRNDRIYLAGESRSQLMNLNNKSFRLLNTPTDWSALRVRGINQRDVFEAHYGSEVIHFNGVGWHLYPELKTLNTGGIWFFSAHPTQDFVLLGGFYETALNGFPVVVRGYR